MNKIYQRLASLRAKAGVLALLVTPAVLCQSAFGFNRAIMEGLPATNNAILVSTGSSASTSQVTVQNLAVDQLPANQCVQTLLSGGHVLLQTSGLQCGSGGGSVSVSSGTLAIFNSGVLVSSPTPGINFDANFAVTLVGTTTALSLSNVTGAGQKFIVNSAGPQSGAIFSVSSGSVNGQMVIVSTYPPTPHYFTIENPVLYVQYNAAISPSPAGSQSEAIYGDFLSTSGAVSPSGDGIGVHGRARETSVGNGQLIGVMGEVFGQGNATAYSGLWGTAGYASDLTAGTTANIEGLRVIAQITNLAGTVPRSTGTLIGINIPDFSDGTGAANKTWVIYANGGYPSFWRGFQGFGQRLPSAPLHVQVTTNTQFGLVIASGPVANTADVDSTNNTFTVTNTGVMFAKAGIIVTGPSTIIGTQNPGGTADVLRVNYQQSLTGSERAVAIRGSFNNTSTNSGTLSVGVGMQAVSTDSSTVGANGTLEGLDARASGFGYGAQYAGAVVHGNWDAALQSGTTATIVGLQVTNSITNGDGVTALSTGTLKQLLISDPTGSGDTNQSWAIYSTSRFPVFLNNFLGIGDRTPTASLSVAASTNTTYSIAAGSVPFFSGVLPSANYNFTVTNDGQVTAKGLTSKGITLSGTLGAGGILTAVEGTVPSGVASSDILYADSSSHALSVINNSGTASPIALLGATQTWTAKQTFTGITTTSSATVAGLSATAHLNVRSGAPGLSSCGASPSNTGTDNAGTITEGTGSPTGCTVTFASAWTNTPFCVAQTTSTVTTAAVTATSASQFTLTASTLVPSMTINYICVGRD